MTSFYLFLEIAQTAVDLWNIRKKEGGTADFFDRETGSKLDQARLPRDTIYQTVDVHNSITVRNTLKRTF